MCDNHIIVGYLHLYVPIITIIIIVIFVGKLYIGKWLAGRAIRQGYHHRRKHESHDNNIVISDKTVKFRF